MNIEDKMKLVRLAEEFSRTPEGAFLREFRWQEIPFETESRRCNVKSGVLGVYHAVANRIGLMESCDPALIASTYIHELRHACQRKELGLIGYLLQKSMLRPLIEREARQSEEDFENWMHKPKHS